MIAFIKIVFTWKLDNKPSYLRAPAIQFDKKTAPTDIFQRTHSHKMLQALQNAMAAGKQLGTNDLLSLIQKQRKTKWGNYSIPQHKNSKIFSCFLPKAMEDLSNIVTFTLLSH